MVRITSVAANSIACAKRLQDKNILPLLKKSLALQACVRQNYLAALPSYE